MRYLIIVLSMLCTAITAGAAHAEKRVAFVVGNGTYKNVAALPNPPIDAKSMAAALRNVGFEVVEGTNLTRDKMTEKLLDFGKKAEGADVARQADCAPSEGVPRRQVPGVMDVGLQSNRRQEQPAHGRLPAVELLARERLEGPAQRRNPALDPLREQRRDALEQQVGGR